MANTFKNASLVSVDNSSADTLYTTPGSTTSIILGVAIANKTSNVVSCKLSFTDNSASTTTEMIPDVAIPGNTTLEVLAGQKYVLEAADTITALADTASAIDITMGLMEIT